MPIYTPGGTLVDLTPKYLTLVATILGCLRHADYGFICMTALWPLSG